MGPRSAHPPAVLAVRPTLLQQLPERLQLPGAVSLEAPLLRLVELRSPFLVQLDPVHRTNLPYSVVVILCLVLAPVNPRRQDSISGKKGNQIASQVQHQPLVYLRQAKHLRRQMQGKLSLVVYSEPRAIPLL